MDSPEDRIKALAARLRSPLPVCPYDRRSPDYYTAPDDKPCVVCGQENTAEGPDLCRGADTRCMAEAATELEALSASKQAVERELADDREAAALIRRASKVMLPLVHQVEAAEFVLALMAACAEERLRIMSELSEGFDHFRDLAAKRGAEAETHLERWGASEAALSTSLQREEELEKGLERTLKFVNGLDVPTRGATAIGIMIHALLTPTGPEGSDQESAQRSAASSRGYEE